MTSAGDEAGTIVESVPHSETLRYIPGLDGLRGIAVLAVVLTHAPVPGFKGGFVGVDVFFLLSGFLITRILIRRGDRDGNVSFRHFYSRRVRRIIPALWAMFVVLTIVALIDPVFSPPEEYFHSLGLAAVFLTQFQMALGELPGPFIHLWSLGWEENFYLAWPVVFALLGLRHRRVLTGLMFGAALSLNAMRFINYYTSVEYHGIVWWIWYAAYCRVDAILLGCTLALVINDTHDGSTFKWKKTELVLGLSALVLLCWMFTRHDQFFWAGGFTLVSVCSLVMTNHLRRRENTLLARVLETRFLRWTGLISYGLYLWHIPVMHWTRQHDLSSWWAIFVGIPLSYGIAALSYYTVEAWFRTKRATT